jgi:Xaa-Pro aminopeptidase
MEPGMITSIEPGIYRPGHWGIRIENLVLNAQRRAGRVRRIPRLRDADPVPDRHPLHRPVADARRRSRSGSTIITAQVRARLLPLVDGAARDWLELRTKEI